MLTYKVCDATTGDYNHYCDPCLDTENGNIRAFALVKADMIPFPFAQESDLTAGIEDGDIIVIPNTNGTFDGGTPKMGAGYGGEKERKVGDDYVLAVKDPSYSDSTNEFWSKVEKYRKWNLIFITGTMMHYVNADVRITAKAPVEADIDSEVVWNIEAKWFSKTKPEMQKIGIFAKVFSCFEIE